MPSYFNIILDTTAPAGIQAKLNGGDVYTADQLAALTVTTTDSDTVGYQYLIWGSVDPSFDANVQATEGASSWITYAELKEIKLSTGTGLKTIYVKVRDDVLNTSGQVSATITFDNTIPVVTISAGPDVPRISKNSTRDTVAVSFRADFAFVEYKIKAVPSSTSEHTAGTLIPTTHGSVNTSGEGSFAADTNISVTIKGADLELASAGDGQKTIKIFVKSASGVWST